MCIYIYVIYYVYMHIYTHTHTHTHTHIRICCTALIHCPVWLCDPMDCSLPGSSVHGDSPGKNTGVGSHAIYLYSVLVWNPVRQWLVSHVDFPFYCIITFIFYFLFCLLFFSSKDIFSVLSSNSCLNTLSTVLFLISKCAFFFSECSLNRIHSCLVNALSCYLALVMNYFLFINKCFILFCENTTYWPETVSAGK